VKRGHHAHEFYVHARERIESLVELVAMVAHYHSAKPDGLLGISHMLPIGRPWLPGSECAALLISFPYSMPPEFAFFENGDEHVQFAWMLPIAESERAYYRVNGIEALEQQFEQAALDYCDSLRKPVV
jgi:hypothetical protein